MSQNFSRTRKKELGLAELIAMALGGMVGGGIFAILGVSVEHIGNTTPVAVLLGGILALFAAYSYVKLALLYKDEGATYSFFRKTFPESPFASASIGWLVVFGYISTLALYAFTFSSYLCSIFPSIHSIWFNRAVAGGIIALFAVVNLTSVKGMGKIEDWLVYTKIILLLFISGLLAGKGDINQFLPIIEGHTTLLNVVIIASITFVAYEGFQLVIHAYHEMDNPARNVPRAIYSSIGIATILYIALAIGALATIPKEMLIRDKEYALAAGAQHILGTLGRTAIIFGALLATSSAISGTLFGASRLMAVIASDGYLPSFFAHRIKVHIPNFAIGAMALMAFILILTGGLQDILEFGSISFIVVSFLMALANYKKRKETRTHIFPALVAMVGLFAAGLLILYFEWTENKPQLGVVLGVFFVLILGATFYAARNKRRSKVTSQG
ncbi:MAG: amino acid permease [Flavobacteriales bacterium]|nr:amino acid permease [Flavobacteriales bacterium]